MGGVWYSFGCLLLLQLIIVSLSTFSLNACWLLVWCPDACGNLLRHVVPNSLLLVCGSLALQPIVLNDVNGNCHALTIITALAFIVVVMTFNQPLT